MTKRLPSFTILELIITMLISSVITGIIYYSYLTMTRQFISVQKKSSLINEYYLFQMALNHDMENALAILEKDPLIFIMQDSSRWQYRFEPGVVIRSRDANIDSFRVRTANLSVKIMHEQVPLVRQIRLMIQLDDQPFDVIFSKQYTATELLKPLLK